MKTKRTEKEVKVFEGFSGIGVTRFAMEDISKELGINVSHVGYSEIEKCAVKAYKTLHGNVTTNYGDVTKIDWSKMDIDFLSWTFPCQSLSSAGANDGFVEGSDTKSSLGWEIKKALREMPHKPRTIFVENVGNILSKRHSDIRYQLKNNPNRACPEDINNGVSVFICLPMFLLDEYEDLLRLLVYQTISSMERRGEDWKQGAVLILDELARLGRLENLLPFLAVNRSLGVSALMAYQDFSQIERIYSKEEARTLMNLSEVTYVLSCKDNETTKVLSDLIGNYQEEKITHTRSQLSHNYTGKENISSEYRKIMEVSDFQSLREKKEAILILYGKYFRLKQFRYFEHPVFSKRYKEVIEANKQLI